MPLVRGATDASSTVSLPAISAWNAALSKADRRATPFGLSLITAKCVPMRGGWDKARGDAELGEPVFSSFVGLRKELGIPPWCVGQFART